MKKILEQRINELKTIIDYPYESIEIKEISRKKLERLEQLYNDLFENP